MPRLYTPQVEKLTPVPTQMMVIYPAANTILQVKRVMIVNSGGAVASPQTLDFLIQVLKTITPGTGGTSCTPAAGVDPGDPAPLFTAKYNESVAVSGTTKYQRILGCNSAQGLDTPIPDIVAGGSTQAIQLLLRTALTGAPMLSWYIDVDEVGGAT